MDLEMFQNICLLVNLKIECNVSFIMILSNFIFFINIGFPQGSPVSKVIKDRNQITIQQVIRLQSWGYVLITITYFDSITIVLQSGPA